MTTSYEIIDGTSTLGLMLALFDTELGVRQVSFTLLGVPDPLIGNVLTVRRTFKNSTYNIKGKIDKTYPGEWKGCYYEARYYSTETRKGTLKIIDRIT